jgi:hypothetical protein
MSNLSFLQSYARVRDTSAAAGFSLRLTFLLSPAQEHGPLLAGIAHATYITVSMRVRA